MPTSPQYRRGCAIRMTKPVTSSVRKLAEPIQCAFRTNQECGLETAGIEVCDMGRREQKYGKRQAKLTTGRDDG